MERFFPCGFPSCLPVTCCCSGGLGRASAAGCSRDTAGMQAARRGIPFVRRGADACPRSPGSSTCGQPSQASWQHSFNGDKLTTVQPECRVPGANGNQSWAPACPRGRGLHCGQRDGRQETGSVSILAPASLRKTTENISPQASKTRAANRLLCFLPLTWNFLAVVEGTRTKEAEEK